MGKKEAKTNAIRILETMKIPYEARTYECDDFVDAAQIADKLGLDHAGMYKTITTVGKSGGYYVFVVPIDDEIDFKNTAHAGRVFNLCSYSFGRHRAFGSLLEERRVA